MTTRLLPLLALTVACNGKAPFEDLGDDTRWQRGTSPCAEDARPVMANDTQGRTWVGCGNQEGLHAQDADAEEDDSFQTIDGFENTVVSDLTVDANGTVYAGGNSPSGHVLVSLSGSLLSLESETLLDLTANELDLDAVGTLSVESDGDVRAMSGDGMTMAWNGPLGVWTESRDWTEAGIALGEDGSHTMVSLEARGDTTIGAGSNDSGQPTIYLPSSNALATYHMTEVAFTTDSILTHATFSGEQMVAIGQTADGGPDMFWCAEGCVDADSWSRVDIAALAELDDSDGVLTDIDFSSDGMTGLAIGEIPRNNSVDGYAVMTLDGGITWTRISEPFPRLDSCTVDDDGTFHVAGDASFYATGTLKSDS